MRVAIFLSVLDVHVNRAPIAGTVTQNRLPPGQILSAADDKACDENERNAILLPPADRARISWSCRSPG